MKILKIKTFDGFTIEATLNYATKKKRNVNVLLIHGIFSTKEESGRFLRLENKLLNLGFNVVKYDHRGHGANPIPSEKMRVCDTVTDLCYIIKELRKIKGELYIIASSYGASILLLGYQLLEFPKVEKIVMLNPVVDYYTTFIKPIGNQIKQIFNEEKLKNLRKIGRFNAINNIIISISFYNELQLLKPYLGIEKIQAPLIVIHGSNDTAVSYDICKNYFTKFKKIQFITIEGANHAFNEQKYERQAHNRIIEFIT